MEEIPPHTWEQVPQYLSPERCEVTGESSEEDEDNSSEVNCKDDQVEFIKEFQEVMNQAIEQLFKKKSARRHSHRKDKPEPHTEQGNHKETIHKEAETLPPRNISREFDNE